ncbi:hypothetical protein BB560_001732 [Smittium megazygosporum]|uniref:Uncharacterized protein n=1 Tax=Smittium megazygosporum TaxID=133381 RepID=A0A2T9ZGR6_9FUNG|nr:hypothetical protein BB560_001732 [Smittium megazygosporum]
MFKPLEYIFLLLLVSNSVLSSVAPKFELENKDINLSRRQIVKLDDSRFTLNCSVSEAVFETITINQTPVSVPYYQGSKVFQVLQSCSSNPFTLNRCASGYFYLTFSIDINYNSQTFFGLYFVNGIKSILSYPSVDYRFHQNGPGGIFYRSEGQTNYTNSLYPPQNQYKGTSADTFFILHDETGSKIGVNGLVTASLTNPGLNKFISDKNTKARLFISPVGSAYINSSDIKCLATDTCLSGSQASSSSPSSGGGGGGGSAPSGDDSLRNAASIITVTTTATTTVSGISTEKSLPTNQIATDSLTVKSLKSNKNYSENEKINIPCSGDFTLSLTSNSRDSDLFFGFSDANGIIKDAKFVELQIGLKNGQNAIKDLVTANVKRSNLFKRQGSAKINIVYVNGIYSLLSNGQSFTTFKGTNIAPKSLTITPFDGTVTLSNFLLACM